MGSERPGAARSARARQWRGDRRHTCSRRRVGAAGRGLGGLHGRACASFWSQRQGGGCTRGSTRAAARTHAPCMSTAPPPALSLARAFQDRSAGRGQTGGAGAGWGALARAAALLMQCSAHSSRPDPEGGRPGTQHAHTFQGSPAVHARALAGQPHKRGLRTLHEASGCCGPVIGRHLQANSLCKTKGKKGEGAEESVCEPTPRSCTAFVHCLHCTVAAAALSSSRVLRDRLFEVLACKPLKGLQEQPSHGLRRRVRGRHAAPAGGKWRCPGGLAAPPAARPGFMDH